MNSTSRRMKLVAPAWVAAAGVRAICAFHALAARQTLALLLALILVTSSFVIRVEAADGDADNTFNTDGKLTTDFFGQSDFGNDLGVQSDGKIVVVGRVVKPDGESDFGLARYESNGAPDASFGIGGKVTTDFFGFNDGCFAVAMQPDGKILAAGGAFADGSVTSNNFALARYNSDGSLDVSFGTDGKIGSDLGGGINDQALDIEIQADGKIVALVGEAAGANSNFILVRYNLDGSLDAGFGGGFPVNTDFFGGDDFPSGLALQSNGKIVATGAAEGGIGDFDFALVQYNSDGSPDAAFGIGGKVTTDFFGGVDSAHSVVVQSDGKIISAGLANEFFGDSFFALARYNTDGGPDASFGIGGKVTTAFSGIVDGIGEVALACDGKIVVAGAVNGFGIGDAGVVRYNIDGGLDAGFGNGGKIITDFLGGDDLIRSLVIQTDGKILIGGTAQIGDSFESSDFALARYDGEACVIAPCPNPLGYWKSNPDAWPVTSLTLGNQVYDQAESLNILNMPTNGDASLILAKQLISSKLNLAAGSDAGPVSTAIATGDGLLSGLNGKLPYKIKPSSAAGQAMTAIGGVLESYNNGLLTVGCAP